MQSSKQKLDELLGISADQSIDDFLAEITNDVGKSSDIVNTIDERVHDAVANIDLNLNMLSSASYLTDITKTNEINAGIVRTLDELHDLIDTSKSMIKHVYQNIITSDLVDAEVINSAGILIEGARVNISEYLDLYKSRIAFYDKIRFEMLKHQHDLEKMHLKQQFDIEKMKLKEGPIEKDVQNITNVEYNQETIIKMLNDYDKQQV